MPCRTEIFGGWSDRSAAGRPHPRGGRAHVRAGGLGAAGRLGRRGHQDRARRAGRRHAGPGLDRRRPSSPSDVHALLEHSNRGKRSLGLDLTSPEGLEILYKLAATADVFLTNKLPSVRDEAQDRASTTSGPTTRHHLRARHRAGRARARTPTRAPTTRWLLGRAGVAVGAKPPEYDLVAGAARPRASATPSGP